MNQNDIEDKPLAHSPQEEEIKAKKTVLSDDASIYSNRRDTTDTKVWKTLDAAGKWEYFKNYYMLKLMIIIVVIGFLTYVGITVFGPHVKQTLYVVTLEDQLDDKAVDHMTKELSQSISTDKYHQILIDDSFNFATGNATVTNTDKLSTLLYSNIIDVIVMNPDRFKHYSYYGNLMNLDHYLPDDIKAALKDELVTANVQLEDTQETSTPDYSSGTPLVFGIDLRNCKKYQELKPMTKEPIFTIAANSPNKENTIQFIRYLFDLDKK